MKLRARFFLLVWSLVVSAMVVLAIVLGRLSVRAIQQVSVQRTVSQSAAGTSEQQITSVVDVLEPPQSALVRRILLAVVIGSVLAGIAAAALAKPLVGRVTDMARLVRSVRTGSFAARVPVRGNDELTELAVSFNDMANDLEESERRRRQMLSDVSHELRTPLTNVLGGLEAMIDGLQKADGAQLASLHDEALLLVRLVDDLRDVTLADAGELVMHPESLDAISMAQQAVAAFPAASDRAPIVVEGYGRAGRAFVVADRNRLAQILRNLLSNARTHAPVDTTIRLEVSCIESRVRFAVRNAGPAIPAEQLPFVWDRFYRVDPSRSRATGGMGLGLAIVKRLVEAQGGIVGAESSHNNGTTFWVELPA